MKPLLLATEGGYQEFDLGGTEMMWLFFSALTALVAIGVGFSLSFPSLALLVVEEVDERTRGATMGAFTAFFDIGVGIGGPLAGAVSAVAGYPAAFAVGAACAVAGGVVAVRRPLSRSA